MWFPFWRGLNWTGGNKNRLIGVGRNAPVGTGPGACSVRRPRQEDLIRQVVRSGSGSRGSVRGGEVVEGLGPCLGVLEVAQVRRIADDRQPARRYGLMESLCELDRETHVLRAMEDKDRGVA